MMNLATSEGRELFGFMQRKHWVRKGRTKHILARGLALALISLVVLEPAGVRLVEPVAGRDTQLEWIFASLDDGTAA